MIECSAEEANAWRANRVTIAVLKWLDQQIDYNKELICDVVSKDGDARVESGMLKALRLVKAGLAVFGTNTEPEEEVLDDDPSRRDPPNVAS
jgi:hypothetical protein